MTKKRLHKIYNAIIPHMNKKLYDEFYNDKFLHDLLIGQRKKQYYNFEKWYSAHSFKDGKRLTNFEIYYENLAYYHCVCYGGDFEKVSDYAVRTISAVHYVEPVTI